jgi:hypothetical protein
MSGVLTDVGSDFLLEAWKGEGRKPDKEDNKNPFIMIDDSLFLRFNSISLYNHFVDPNDNSANMLEINYCWNNVGMCIDRVKGAALALFRGKTREDRLVLEGLRGLILMEHVPPGESKE